MDPSHPLSARTPDSRSVSVTTLPVMMALGVGLLLLIIHSVCAGDQGGSVRFDDLTNWDDKTHGKLINPVVIAEWRTDLWVERQSFPVDSTVKALQVETHGGRFNPRLKLFDPNGEFVTENRTDVTLTRDKQSTHLRINEPLPGRWNLTFARGHMYNVTVRGSSILQFSSRFYDRRGYRLPGNPVTGQNITLAISFLGNEYLKSLDDVIMTSWKGRRIVMQKVGHAIGTAKNEYRVMVRVPSEVFRIGVRGTDKHSYPFTRLHTTNIKPDGILLRLDLITRGAVVAGGTYIYKYTISNEEAAVGFNVTVRGLKKFFSYSIHPCRIYIPGRGRGSGNITVHVSGDADTGTSSRMEVIVTSDTGESQFSNRELVVKEKHRGTDTNPPDFFLTDVIDNCEVNNICNSTTWDVIFMVEDDESGLHRVDVDNHTVSEVTMETYADGTANTYIKGKLRTNCCQKETTVIVEDVKGNKNRFPVIYPGPDVQNASVSTTQPLSSLQIGAVVVGSLTACLVIVILGTVVIQFKPYCSSVKTAKKTPKQKKYIQMVSTVSSNTLNQSSHA